MTRRTGARLVAALVAAAAVTGIVAAIVVGRGAAHPARAAAAQEQPVPVEQRQPSESGSTGRQDNPYADLAGWYVNPEWAQKVTDVPGGEAIADQPTAVWLDRIAAIEGSPGDVSNGSMGLRDHLDEAVRQQEAAGGGPFVFQFVTYNLPGRDCAALASNGELGPDELPRYRSEYIDVIAEILADPVYASLRIVTVVEVDSLPNLVTNAGQGPASTPLCEQVAREGQYVDGVRYALDSYAKLPNVYSYIDAGHHGWLGWDNNFTSAAALLAETVLGSESQGSGVAGVVTNTANTSATTEPYVPFPLTEEDRSSDWLEFNRFADETTFATAFRAELVSRGLAPDIGVLIDTSRNGWGGPQRPDGTGTSIDERRVDRRSHAGSWCNQSGAGLGERPTAAPTPDLDAYVWVKPPGESDGASQEVPNDEGKGFDRMCDPTFGGNVLNGNNPTGALPDAPLAGAFFPAQLEELIANAHPPVR